MVPTVIGAVVPDRMDVEELSGIALTTSPPLLYYYGHHELQANPRMYQSIVSTLASVVNERATKSQECTILCAHN